MSAQPDHPAGGTASAVVDRPPDSVSGELRAVSGGDEVGIDVPELRFVRPLPGFAEMTRFALVRLDHAESTSGAPAGTADADIDLLADDDPVLFELRCLQAPDVRFLVAAPMAFFPDYSFELDEAAVAELGLNTAEEAMVLVVLTVGADPASTTANLLAPVVVNVRNRSAAQVILSGTDWPVRAAVV
jgi:flagellar assembly factor FliW